MKYRAWVVAWLLLTAACSASALQETPVTTRHQLMVNGHSLRYTAIAGRIAIRDVETGNPHGYIYFTGYRAISPGRVRPLTFLWNGGPGSNSAPLHFEAFGPKRMEEGRLVDNDSTLLATTDLVFVDPVGTGFSRPAKEKYAQEFYGTLGDIASVTEFVRAWVIQFHAQDAPLFLVGESYGVWRASGVAEALEKQGRRVAGIVLISGGAGVGKVIPANAASAYRIPNMAATALYYHRLSPDLGTNREQVIERATEWATDTYLPALEHRDSLTAAERQRIAEGIARYTGYPASEVDAATLTVTPREYLHGLLRSEGKVLDSLDMRRTGPIEMTPADVVDSYLRYDLGYRTDLVYLGLDTPGLDKPGGKGYFPTPGPRPKSPAERWEYNSAPMTAEAIASAKAGEGPPGAQPWTLRAMKLNPRMKVLVAAGIYDSLNSCSANQNLLERLEPKVAKNFRMQCYPGGHMMYLDADVRKRLSTDITEFIRATDR